MNLVKSKTPICKNAEPARGQYQLSPSKIWYNTGGATIWYTVIKAMSVKKVDYYGYEVSSDGYVRRHGRALKFSYGGRYRDQDIKHVSLSVDNSIQRKAVHTLIYRLFSGDKDYDSRIHVILHRDSDTGNNNIDNLYKVNR